MKLLRLLLLLPRQRLSLLLVILPSHPDIREEDHIGRNGRRDAPDSSGPCVMSALQYIHSIYTLLQTASGPGRYNIPPKSTVTKYMPMGVVIMATVNPRSL